MTPEMKALVARAKEVMAKEPTFDSKEKALEAAVKQARNQDELISVWKAPNDMGGKYTVVQFENREEAGNCGYEEVYDTGTIFDKVKENYDNIKEV